MVCVLNGFEKVGSADYFSNAPKMQGGFNFEFLNATSALERAGEALHTEATEIWISLRCSNRIDHRKFVQDPKLSSRWNLISPRKYRTIMKRSRKCSVLVPESEPSIYTKISNQQLSSLVDDTQAQWAYLTVNQDINDE